MALNNSLYQLENLVIGLLEALNDKNVDVQDSISLALVELGRKKTDFILNTSRSFMIKNALKLGESQRVYILNTVQKIIKENIDSFEEQTAIGLIELASNEMTAQQQKEPIVSIQTAASNLLVAIGIKYVKQVFTELLKQFNPGVLPHLFILNTMANLAEINAFGVVPQLSGVLASMLPMLGMAKFDNYKSAFASSLCKFSEAILYYCSNKDKAPDKSIDKSLFSTQIYAAHEILFNVWIKTSDNKLRQTIIEAIGYFVHLIETEKLESDLNKIIPGILGLYKKHPDSHIVSQAICMIISAINESQILTIEILLEQLLKELFSQLLTTIETSNTNPNALKNQNELLRCFTELSVRFCDKILPFLLQKFEQNNEKLRVGSLTVIRHIINSATKQMANKRELVLSGLRPILSDPNAKVKRHLIQTIVAMGHHGYLNLEGGNLMIEFIIKQCALPDTEIDPKKASAKDADQSDTAEQLRSTAENVLTLFSTTVENMQDTLWPHLFEYVTHAEYTRAISQICKNLAFIAEKKRTTQAADYQINFKDLINIPRQHDIFARLFTIAGVPLANKNRGLNALNLLKNISPIINPGVVDLWDSVIPKLMLNFEDQLNNNKFEQRKWEDLLLKMLSKSLEMIQDEKEVCEFGNSFGKQIGTLIANSPDEKHFAFKCLGIILSRTESKTFIDKHLNIIFNSVNHAVQTERDGCAIGFGYAASVHLDTVLQKLETCSKNEAKKSGGLFSNILKDSKSADPDQLKATLVLCYGYVTLYASQELIISRLEANILRSVTTFSTNVKDLILKQNILKSMEIITKCMHPDHLQKDFNFSYKSNLLELMMNFISSENSPKLNNEIKSMCYKVCSNIVKLNPKPTEADFFTLIKTVTDSFYPLQLPDDNKPKVDAKDAKQQASVGEKKEPIQSVNETDSNLLHGSALYETTANAVENLLNEILNRDLNSTGLLNIYKHLEPYITSINDHERERALRTISSLLKYFASNFKLASNELQAFNCFGSILGRLVGRTTDPILKIRYNVNSSIYSLLNALCIYHKYEGPKLAEEQEQLKAIQVCGEKLLKNDPNLLLNAVNDLSKVLCPRIPNDQIVQFIEKLIEGLLDVQSHCSVASCIVLKHCVKLRGAELENQVDSLIRHLYSKLSLIQNPQTKQGTLRTIRTIFQLHLVESLNVILTFPIPCNKDMIDICQSLTEDSQLVSDIIEHILQIWSRCLPYEERINVKYASMTPLIGTCLLTEIFTNNKTPETEEVFKKNFEKIFSSLLLRVASTLNNQMPVPKSKEENEPKADEKNQKSTKTAVVTEYKKLEPIRISIECFKGFIKCTQSYELLEYFDKERLWDLLGEEITNIEACSILAKGLCFHGTQYLLNIVNNLMSYLCAPYDCQKISVTAFFAELLNNKCVVDLTELLMNNLLSKLIDPCTPVRTLCIKGLGNISSLGAEEVQKHSTTILSAMMAGLDDKDDFNDDITLESMNGLSKIIALIDENNVRPILLNILLRIRPCFEKERGNIRSSAYILFGKLTRFGHGPSRDPFIEQIHSNFVSFILHLNENDQIVKKSCKYTLRQVGPLLNSDAINDLFQKALIDDVPLHYGEFINNLSKILINDFPDKVSFYIMNSVANFKSQWPEIRSNAVLFAGYLLGNLNKDKQSVLSKEHIANALIKLLKEDPSPMVRIKAADAMSLLHDF